LRCELWCGSGWVAYGSGWHIAAGGSTWQHVVEAGGRYRCAAGACGCGMPGVMTVRRLPVMSSIFCSTAYMAALIMSGVMVAATLDGGQVEGVVCCELC
jgi:hypothetical protein